MLEGNFYYRYVGHIDIAWSEVGTSGRVLSGQDPESHQESGEGRGEGGEPGAVARRPKREQVTKVTGLYREGQLG